MGLLLDHCVGLAEGLPVSTLAEARGDLVCDTTALEEKLPTPVALCAPLGVAATDAEATGLPDTLVVELVEELGVPKLAEARGDPVCDATAEEDAVPSPVALCAPLGVAATDPEAAGLPDTLVVELVEELGVPKLAEAGGDPVREVSGLDDIVATPVGLSDVSGLDDIVATPVALKDVSGLDEALVTPVGLSDVSGLDEALATPVALLAGLVLAATLQDASDVPLTLCTGLVEALNVPKLGELAAVALGDWLSVEETLADPVAL